MSDIDISILVNNEEYGTTGAFLDASEQDIHNHLASNVYPGVLLTQHILKSFKQRKHAIRKRSLLIQTSSNLSTKPVPFAAALSSTKRFVDFMGYTLSQELSEYNVDVCFWKPAIIVNPKADKRSYGMFGVTP